MFWRLIRTATLLQAQNLPLFLTCSTVFCSIFKRNFYLLVLSPKGSQDIIFTFLWLFLYGINFIFADSLIPLCLPQSVSKYCAPGGIKFTNRLHTIARQNKTGASKTSSSTSIETGVNVNGMKFAVLKFCKSFEIIDQYFYHEN